MDICYLDIGNSRAKYQIKNQRYTQNISDFKLKKLLDLSDEIWVASVNNDFYIESNPKLKIITTNLNYKNLSNQYDLPLDLGVDRWLNLISAYEMYSGQNTVIIDAGTAITIDLLNNKNIFSSGVIMPGLKTIRSSISKFETDVCDLMPTSLESSTSKAWLSGTSHMIISSINSYIEMLKNRVKINNIIITGGDSLQIAKFIDQTTLVDINLTLKGIKYYADYMR